YRTFLFNYSWNMCLTSMFPLGPSPRTYDENQSIAGVLQVTSLNYLNQPQYAFNASEARRICLSLGLSIATKAQVERALSRGLETCRFGWIDEHFAVIPRIQALVNCGKNQTGLVPWRASVTQKKTSVSNSSNKFHPDRKLDSFFLPSSFFLLNSLQHRCCRTTSPFCRQCTRLIRRYEALVCR
uniref:Link domain-containing protein n=1 Tax=Amphiprion ocellaris TaxID=80972 RepID=A0AAQ5ZI07_AMPOC